MGILEYIATYAQQHLRKVKSLNVFQTLHLCIHAILISLPLHKLPHRNVFVTDAMLSIGHQRNERVRTDLGARL